MEAQLAVALNWAARGEARFALRALDRLYAASRRNLRQRAGSEAALAAQHVEQRADSLLEALPPIDALAQNLRHKRFPAEAPAAPRGARSEHGDG